MAPKLYSVTEIAPKLSFLCVVKSPIRYDFRAGAKAIRSSMNVTFVLKLSFILALFTIYFDLK